MIYLRKANKYEKKDYPDAVATITIGKHEAQLTQKEVDLLHGKLNKFATLCVSNRSLAKEAFNAAREETHRPKYHGVSNPKGTIDDYWDDTYEDFDDWWSKHYC